MSSEITSYHAHVYFAEETYQQAVELCDKAGEIFPVSVGRKHQRPVGPHPVWSCQLAFTPDLYDKIIPWLEDNRNGLTVFVHANTGNDLRDHTENLRWLGNAEKLNLSIFED